MVSLNTESKIVLNNKTIFKDQLKHDSNSKLLLKTTIITISIMVCSLIMGVIFAQQNIFLISALFGLFGQNIVAFNVTNLLVFVLSGGAIGLLISFFTSRNINKKTQDYFETIPPMFLVDKTFESIMIPLIFAIKDLSTKSPEFNDSFIQKYKQRLNYFITTNFGYEEESSKDFIENYFQMEISQMAEKIKQLDFKVEISNDKQVVKRDLSFLRKNFKEYFRTITNPSGTPCLIYTQKQVELIKKEEVNMINLLSKCRK